MDDKRELNDILIGGDDDHRSSQSKKIILLLVGIIILVTAIVVIIMTMLSGNKDDEVIATNKENYPKVKQSIDIPIDTNDDDKFEQIVQEIKAQQQKNEVKEMPLKEESKEAEIPKITMPEKPKPKATPPKQIAKLETPRVINRKNNGDIATSGHYLQVGAFSKKPNQQFLDKLNMYSYRTQEILINSKVITRYLIGPYNSKNEAQKDYENVSRDISTPVYLRIK